MRVGSEQENLSQVIVIKNFVIIAIIDDIVIILAIVIILIVIIVIELVAGEVRQLPDKAPEYLHRTGEHDDDDDGNGDDGDCDDDKGRRQILLCGFCPEGPVTSIS